MKIAVIGGIGSGKSEVMKVAKEMGITCLSADEINDALLHEPVYISKIASRFPECVAHGVVDKPKLASVVFSDEKKRRALNDIAHPEIARRIAECDADPLAVELPLALESGMATAFDEVILVSAPKSLRLKRLERRGVPGEDSHRDPAERRVPFRAARRGESGVRKGARKAVAAEMNGNRRGRTQKRKITKKPLYTINLRGKL